MVANEKHLAVIISCWEKFTLHAAEPQKDFFESGGDSLAAINMITELQKNFSMEISLEQFMRNPSISFLQDRIKAQIRVI